MYDTDADWNHCNGIDYNAALDQIVISVRQFSEAWVIDHSTTPTEAAGSSGGNCGKGGDLLYRWGNPTAYDRGGASDQRLFVQHNVHWIPPNRIGDGHFLVFNNGTGRPGGNYSSVDEWISPLDGSGCYTQQMDGSWGPTGACWSYTTTPKTTFYSHHISGAQRMTNGNTLICDGEGGHFFEVTYSGQEVWSYESPVIDNNMMVTQGIEVAGNRVFRAERYLIDSQALNGLTLTAGHTLEIYPEQTDYDGDNMEDAWECLNSLNPALATDAVMDPDADEISNRSEYIADTDPTDSNSFFAIEVLSNTTNFSVFFESSSNRSYSLQRCDDLVTGLWVDVDGQTHQPGSGGTDHLSDTNITSRGLYEVRVTF